MEITTEKGKFVIEEYNSMLALDYKFIWIEEYPKPQKNITITKESLGRFTKEELFNKIGTEIDISSFNDPILFKIF